MNSENLVITLHRNAQLFTKEPGLATSLEKIRQVLFLAPDQLLHPEADREYVVRLGKLQVSQFMADGREVTRAVLQAGSILTVREGLEHGDNPASDVYNLPDMILMALGETELWSLPAGNLF